jgi:hypothetical protein
MKRWIAPLAGLMIAGAVAVPTFAQSQSVNSTGQSTDAAGVRGVGALICSTSNPTDTVAKALGMTASELRLELVSGKTVSQIATSKNVDAQVIIDALSTQRKADLDQALKDGLLTQAQYDTITQAMPNAPALDSNTLLRIRVPAYNVVNIEAVTAEALGISCADLLKAQQGGNAIAQIATDKGVDVQAVIDAVTKAYKDALAADVQEGLITQAESDGRLSQLTLEIGQWVYNTRRGLGPNGNRPFGPGMGDGSQHGFGNRGEQRGPGMPNPPQGFNQQNAPTTPQQPAATTTPNA